MDIDYKNDETGLFDSGIHLEIQDQKLLKPFNYRTSEFVAFTVYRLWYLSNGKRTGSTRIYNIKEPDWVHATPVERIPAPLNCEEWYHQYVNQVYHFLNKGDFEASVVLIALLYVARMRFAGQLTNASPPAVLYQLLTGAMMAAQKTNSDIRYTLKGWVAISGFDFEDVKLTESCFLEALGWDLYVTVEQYENWISTLYKLAHEHRMIIKSSGLTDEEFGEFAKRHMMQRVDVIKEADLIRRREAVTV